MKAAAVLPTMLSSDDYPGVRCEASLSTVTLAVPHNTARLCWVSVSVGMPDLYR